MISKMIDFLFSKGNKFKIIEFDYTKDKVQMNYDDLFCRKVDALVVRNFFNKDEIQKIKSEIAQIPEEEFLWHDERYRSLPPVFEYMNNLEDTAAYFRLSNEKEKILNRYLSSISIENRCIEWFADSFKTSREKISRIKLNPEMTYPFPSGCLRLIPPGYGEIKIHADNNFYPSGSPVFENFSSTVNLSNHISYIITIQKAEEGGNLVLHDIDQFEYAKLSQDGRSVIHNRTQKEYPISLFSSQEIIANEGDLVLFSGGRIWHSVNKMKGDSERITYGGFSAIGQDKQMIYLWT